MLTMTMVMTTMTKMDMMMARMNTMTTGLLRHVMMKKPMRLMTNIPRRKIARLQATCGWKKSTTACLKSMQISLLTHYHSQKSMMITMSMMKSTMKQTTTQTRKMTMTMKKGITKLDTLSFTLRKREITDSLYLLM